MPAGQISALQTQLTSSGGSALKAWSISANGLNPNEPIGLAIAIGNGYLTQGLAIWQWNGSAWSAFNATDLSFGNGYADFTITATGGYAVTTAPLASTWNNSSGNWSDSAKWYPAVPANGSPLGTSYNATINLGLVTLDADASINSLQLTGGTLTGAHTLTLLSGGTITGNYSVTGTTLNGGTLVLTSLSPFSGNLNNAGTFAFNNTGPLSVAGSITGTGNVSQLGTGTTTLSKNMSISGSLSISAGKLALTPDGASHSSPALDVGSLAITGTGTLDLKDRDAIIRNVPDPVAFATLITTGKITSSTSAPGNGGQTIGYGIAGQIGGIQGHGIASFDGTPVSPTNMILKYTAPGDVTLDGSADSFDLLAILNNFGTLYNGPTWWLGDVTGDGSVDSFDLLTVLNNFGNLVGGSFNQLDTAGSDTSPALDGSPATAPVSEPASLAMLGLGAGALCIRRYRRL
jgi:fibronectin-binding autotransporter adhesin